MRLHRRKTRITYEGLSFLLILAFIVLGSILRQINLLVLLSGLMIAPFFFNWRISRKMLERVVFSRRLPPWAHAKTRFSVDWQAINQGNSLPAWEIRIDDNICSTNSSEPDSIRASVVIHQVNPGQKAVGQFMCAFSKRGVYEFGPARANSAFPMGLIRTTIALPETQRLIVAPELVRLCHNWLAAIRSSAPRQQDCSDRRTGRSHEGFFALRNWQAGDSRRLVHWRSSAKRGELLVRQGVDPDALQTTILFDFGTDAALPVSASSSELLASIAATIVCQQASSRDRSQQVVAIRGDRSSGIPVQSGPRTLPTLLECLATIQSVETTGIFDAVQSQSRKRVAANRLIVLSHRSFTAACLSENVKESAAVMSGRLTWVDVTNDSRLIQDPALQIPASDSNSAPESLDPAAETADQR